MIKQLNKDLYDAVEKMLQGLCYWMGYRLECYAGHTITEGATVEIAVGILNAHLDHHTFVVKCEYPYKKIDLRKNKERADIVILEKRKDHKGHNDLIPICVLEFKMATDANGGVWEDVKKLATLPKNLCRLAVLLANGNPSIVNDFILFEKNDGGVLKERIKRSIDSKRNKNKVPVRVIRSTKAMETASSKNPFRAICIEL